MSKKINVILVSISSLIFLSNSFAQQRSLYNNTYDSSSSNGVIEKNKNKVIIIDGKWLTATELRDYSGYGNLSGYINHGVWEVTKNNGYGFYSSPFYKESIGVPYSLRVEIEVAAKFTSNEPGAKMSIDILNDHKLIYSHKVESKIVGHIDSSGNPVSFEKIIFTVSNIPYAYDLKPQLFVYQQIDKKIFVKSVKYFLTRSAQ
jgi:hypothetical protein